MPRSIWLEAAQHCSNSYLVCSYECSTADKFVDYNITSIWNLLALIRTRNNTRRVLSPTYLLFPYSRTYEYAHTKRENSKIRKLESSKARKLGSSEARQKRKNGSNWEKRYTYIYRLIDLPYGDALWKVVFGHSTALGPA